MTELPREERHGRRHVLGSAELDEAEREFIRAHGPTAEEVAKDEWRT
jgi:hypothetical protein